MSSSADSPAGVVAHSLGKRFGEKWALRDFDLEVPRGTVLGLLGHNGAGKTTAIRILTTLDRCRRAGSAEVAGIDVVHDAGSRPRADRARRPVRERRRPPHRRARTWRWSDASTTSIARSRSRRAAELLERLGLADVADGPRSHVLGRHAPPARPRREPHGAPRGAVPRRADDGARPAGPRRALGADRTAAGGRHDRDPDHAVHRGGRPPRGQRRRARPRPRRRLRCSARAEGRRRWRTRGAARGRRRDQRAAETVTPFATGPLERGSE